MDLTRFFSPESVRVGVSASDKWSLIESLVGTLAAAYPFRDDAGVSNQEILDAVLARERQKNTYLGGGLAVPHARIPGLQRIGICLALLREPLAFNGPDSLTEIVFLVVAPTDQHATVLKILSQIARLPRTSGACEGLLRQASAQEAFAYIHSLGLNVDVPLRARDIMRPPRVFIPEDTPLPQVTQSMQRLNTDAISIVNDEGRLVGEIACDRLFTLGIPDFFTQLKSVSFINEYDPFEKYFVKAAETTAGDIMSRDFAAVDEEATLLEVVFLLAVRKYPRVYVVRDGRTIGIVDRNLVLERIINT